MASNIYDIAFKNDTIYVTIPYDEDAKEALKEKFRARWDPEARHWKINGDDYSMDTVRKELKLHFPKEF